ENCRFHSVYTGAQILRQANMWRSFVLTGKPLSINWAADLLDVKPAIPFRFLYYSLLSDGVEVTLLPNTPQAQPSSRSERLRIRMQAGKRVFERDQQFFIDSKLKKHVTKNYDLPRPETPPPLDTAKVPASVLEGEKDLIGPLTRPGYRAILYPRPKTDTGEDLIMPSALAAT